ncbi:hypothetical protein Nepgr_019143 [Nepenthes gracilis]|uniref:Uncharacterized protein n=1 Tax=Nepenthes gracilis TaxID=150966 RepID=A0AAD3SUH3_NEPGR|nr:hypothetical protein Nepgr_019143 [Nepenthes gracilis]
MTRVSRSSSCVRGNISQLPYRMWCRGWLALPTVLAWRFSDYGSADLAEKLLGLGSLDGDDEAQQLKELILAQAPLSVIPSVLPTAEGANTYQRVVSVQLVGRERFEEQYTTISQWPPSRELIAKNIPDFGWKFKHPILNQIKRHLHTTEGSVFVEAKSLVAVPNCVRPERGREIANSLDHRSNQDVFLEAVVLAQLVETGASNVSLDRVPQASSLDNNDIEESDGGEVKHGTVFLDPEHQAIDIWPKELQQLEHDVKHPRVKLQARELPPPDWDYHAAHLLEAKTQPQDFRGVSEVLQPLEGEERELRLPDDEVMDLQITEDANKPQPMGCKYIELQVSNIESKKLPSFEGNGQELNPHNTKTRELGPLESKNQLDLESSAELEVTQKSECVHLEAHGGEMLQIDEANQETCLPRCSLEQLRDAIIHAFGSKHFFLKPQTVEVAIEGIGRAQPELASFMFMGPTGVGKIELA